MIKARTNAHVKCPKAVSTVDNTNHHTIKADEKYSKRQRQKREEFCFLMLMTLLTLLVLGLMVVLYVLVKGISSSYSHNGNYNYFSIRSSAPSFFQRLRGGGRSGDENSYIDSIMLESLRDWDDAMEQNEHSGIPWLNPKLLIPLPSPHDAKKKKKNPILTEPMPKPPSKFSMHGPFFRVARMSRRNSMQWEDEWKAIKEKGKNLLGPILDYTQDDLYEYPDKIPNPPSSNYPLLKPVKKMFQDWPQDELDDPPSPIVETLQHFDFNTELEMAQAYKDRKLPFKLINVPELLAANLKWTDDYLAHGFDSEDRHKAKGKCQESRHNFFSFFIPSAWNVLKMGLPPTRNNDWTFKMWSEHAKYSDASSLDFDQPHFYWQAGVPKEERELDPSSWSFISADLPSFSSPNGTFIAPSPSEQKGIQCRFGERGVTAANHFDSGKNMVGMITGAKRYVLSPPNQCHHLGIVTSRNSALFRHSMLNYGHLNYLEKKDVMPLEERQWLEKAGNALAVETVLKAGEALYIPSHWFHYIISLQKSAQCNVRSGVDVEGDDKFGGAADVSDSFCNPLLD